MFYGISIYSTLPKNTRSIHCSYILMILSCICKWVSFLGFSLLVLKLQTASTPRKSFLFRCSHICTKCFLSCNPSAVTVCLYVGHVLCRQFSDRHKLLVEQSCREGESLRGCIAPYPTSIPRAAQEAQEGSRRMSVHPFFHLTAVEKPL